QRFLSTLVTLVWALWFGGVVTLFIAVTAIFAAFPGQRDLAGIAATSVFHRFHLYQLALAAACLLASFGWRLTPGATRLKTALFCTFGLATIGTYVITGVITPRIDALRQQAMTASPAFARLHGASMAVYVAVAATLLVAG